MPQVNARYVSVAEKHPESFVDSCRSLPQSLQTKLGDESVPTVAYGSLRTQVVAMIRHYPHATKVYQGTFS